MTRRRPVDLARARAALDRLDAVLAEHPDTRPLPPGALDSDAALATLTRPEIAPMVTQLVIRVHPDIPERVSALLPHLTADPEIRTLGRVTRSTVERMALEKGLALLEERYGLRRPAPAPTAP